ncbi:MAG: hypothetical protein WCG34_05685 [Leptolinea sp.]
MLQQLRQPMAQPDEKVLAFRLIMESVSDHLQHNPRNPSRLAMTFWHCAIRSLTSPMSASSILKANPKNQIPTVLQTILS